MSAQKLSSHSVSSLLRFGHKFDMDSPQEGGSRGRGEDGYFFSLLPKSLFKTAAFVTISVHFKLPIQAGGQEPGKTEGDLAVSYISWEKQFPPCGGRGCSTLCCPLGGRVGRDEGNDGGRQAQGGTAGGGGHGLAERCSRALVYNEISTM